MGITEVFREIQETLRGSFVLILPYGRVLLGSLAVLDITLFGFHIALSGSAQIYEIIKRVCLIAILFYLLEHFPYWADTFVNSLIAGGFTAAGVENDWNLLYDPGGILNIAMDVLAPIEESMAKMGAWRNLGTLIFFSVVFFVVALAFGIMTIIICMTLFEYYLFVIMAGILIPWIAIKPGRFLGQKIISGVLHYGVRLMVLTFLMALLKPMMEKIITGDSVNFSSGKVDSSMMIALLVVILMFTLFIIKGPPMIASLFTGSPSLGGGVGMALGAVVGALSVAKGVAGGGLSRVSGGGGNGKSRVQSALEGMGNGVGSIAYGTGRGVGSIAHGVGRGVGSMIHNPYKQKYAEARARGERVARSSSGRGTTTRGNATRNTVRSGTAVAYTPPYATGNAAQVATTSSGTVTTPVAVNPPVATTSRGVTENDTYPLVSHSEDVAPLKSLPQRKIVPTSNTPWGGYETPLRQIPTTQLLLPPPEPSPLLPLPTQGGSQ